MSKRNVLKAEKVICFWKAIKSMKCKLIRDFEGLFRMRSVTVRLTALPRLLSLFILTMILYGTVFVTADVGVRSASEIENDYIYWIKKVADWQLTQSSWDSSVNWERGALHAGMMAAYEATKDETYLVKCRQWAEKFNWQLGWNNSNHADNMACAQAYLELYFLDEQNPYRYQDFMNQSDDHVALWPEYTCSGTSSNHWWWCDALFMAPPALVRLSRATGNSIYTDFMHMMWEDTQGCLYDTNQHLFYRDMSYVNSINCVGENIFWSRGNGWVLAGIARVLQYLPLNDPRRSGYITLLEEMSAKLKTIQCPDGYWHSDLLGPTCYPNPETSGTGFFTFGMAWGINNGFLDDTTYLPTVTAGWEAMKDSVQPNGLLGWVQPVGQDPQTTSKDTTEVFGVGAYLLAASEMQKYALSKDPMSIEYFESYLTTAELASAWADGDTNGTASTVSLGDYGDNFMELSYQNNASPYDSRVDYDFASLADLTINNAYYLSVLIRGDAGNSAENVYAILKDVAGHTAVQTMTDTTVVQTEEWTELAFPLSDFAGVDLTQVTCISLGIGTPSASSAAGAGTVRIDNIRLSPCVSAQADFNHDCMVRLDDFAVLAAQWLEEYGTVAMLPVDPGTAHLEAYWPLDEDYNDATGNGYDATAGASVAWDAGHRGSSVYFDATDYQSYLACQNSTSMNLTQGATVSVWVRGNGLTDEWAGVITKGLDAWRIIRNGYATGNEVSFHFNAAGGGGISGRRQYWGFRRPVAPHRGGL